MSGMVGLMSCGSRGSSFNVHIEGKMREIRIAAAMTAAAFVSPQVVTLLPEPRAERIPLVELSGIVVIAPSTAHCPSGLGLSLFFWFFLILSFGINQVKVAVSGVLNLEVP
jgi:hypothetical protein